jgi:hypothetical protein
MGFLLCWFLAELLLSCRPSYMKHVSEYHFDTQITVPDYSRAEYWAAIPFKRNPSDSIPLPLQAGTLKDSGVDVFFLHPTTFASGDDTAWNANINDPVISARTDYTTILYQASAFNECRVFAPRYRQANIRSYFTADTANARKAFDLAYEDLRTAFQYYLDHYNQGRPIIIASHSQGSTHSQRLLKEFFENKPLSKKLVVAYIIGMQIPKNYFTSLNPCKDSSQTGCFAGWRTYKRGYEPDFIKKESGNSYISNPLTWTLTEEYAAQALNLGGVLLKFNRVQPQVADAQIHDDILWTRKPRFPGSIFYLTKNYHIGDINLFYVNIRENIRARVKAFRKN